MMLYNYDDLLVANNFLGNQTSFGDNLINALQLEKSISKLNNGKDLAYHAIKLVINDLNKIWESNKFEVYTTDDNNINLFKDTIQYVEPEYIETHTIKKSIWKIYYRKSELQRI